MLCPIQSHIGTLISNGLEACINEGGFHLAMSSLYEALHVDSSVAEAELRSTYRRQALFTHPDKEGTAEAFRLVVAAFETLTDPARRAAYDSQLAQKASLARRRAATGCQNAQGQPTQGQKGSGGKLQRGEEGEGEEAAQWLQCE